MPDSPAKAIQTFGLSKRFGDLTAVNRLSLEIEPGEVVGLLGHNGAGKTTTVRLLNGVLSPTEGNAYVLGLDPATQGPELRRRTGVLTETPSMDERLSARENLQTFAELYGVPRERCHQRIEELLEAFDLGDRGDERVGGYSKGMKQRLALARTLLHEPELLFLDEPTAGLDPVAARGVHELITEVSEDEGRTVVMCTHNLVEAQALCHRVVVLEQGRVVEAGTPQALARRLHRDLGVVLDVAAEQRETAGACLERRFADVRVQVDDERLIAYGLGRERIPDAIAALVNADVRIYGVVSQEASLEDVYFALHARASKETAP